MVIVSLDDMATQADLILGEILNQSLVASPVHRRERIVIHGNDAGRSRTVVDDLDFAKVCTFVESPNVNLFTLLVANLDMAEALSNVEELALLASLLSLLDHVAMWWHRPRAHSFDNAWQEVVHPLIGELELVVVGDAERFVPLMVLRLVRIRNNLSNRFSNRSILLTQDACEDFTLDGDAEWLRDLIKEVIQLVLRSHRTLNLQEVVTDLLLQGQGQIRVLHRSVHRVDIFLQ